MLHNVPTYIIFYNPSFEAKKQHIDRQAHEASLSWMASVLSLDNGVHGGFSKGHNEKCHVCRLTFPIALQLALEIL